MYCTVEKDYFNTASLGVQDYSFTERIQYDTISEIQSKGWTEMSYAGMVLCPKGIVAFADSKASRITMIGNMFEDTQRGKVQKIFSNKHFVMVCTNSNEFYCKGNTIFIEDYFNKNINNYSSWEVMLKDFQDLVFSTADNVEFYLQILIGERKKDPLSYYDRYAIRHIVLSGLGIQISSRYLLNTSSPKLYTIGNRYYTEFDFSNEFKRLHELEDIKEKTIEIVENTIDRVDKLNEYNPVGKPIKTIIFK